MSWQIFTGLAGGIGLFLLGMQLMTDGLKRSAGQSLQYILKKSTQTPLRGIASGALITSMVQSSSAVTVATIGFVNAGLLNLTQAIRVSYGSNLGTTMTGWLVALIGFGVDIKVFALPSIGVGMMLSLFAMHSRVSALGKTLAGFGLFFLGIDLLKSGFSTMDESALLQAVAADGLWGVLGFVAIGFLMTLIMQSSSAAIAVTLTAAAGGVMDLQGAAAMVIGANVGTTSTAVLAAIGATSNAKRVAAGHVLFNVLTGLVALITLPLMLWLVEWFQQSMGMTSGTATFLALFHTLFNVLGIAIMWPFTTLLVRFLQTQFRAAEEDLAQPKYLDKTLIATPSLAHNALRHELLHIRDMAVRMAEDAINTEASVSPRLKEEGRAMQHLLDAVAAFVLDMHRSDLPPYVAETLPHALAASRYLADAAERSSDVDERQSKSLSSISTEVDRMFVDYRHNAISVLEMLKLSGNGMDVDISKLDSKRQQLELEYEGIKSRLLRLGTSGDMSVRQMLAWVELMKQIERVVHDCVKAQRSFALFSERDEAQPVAQEALQDSEAVAALDAESRLAE